MSTNPARIGRVTGQGEPIAIGSQANLCIVDPAAEWTVDPATLASRSRNTPYAARSMRGRVIATFFRGRATVLGGSLV